MEMKMMKYVCVSPREEPQCTWTVCGSHSIVACGDDQDMYTVLLLGIKPWLSKTQPVTFLCRLMLLNQYDLSLRCGKEITMKTVHNVMKLCVAINEGCSNRAV